jgi:hypothetical protein
MGFHGISPSDHGTIFNGSTTKHHLSESFLPVFHGAVIFTIYLPTILGLNAALLLLLFLESFPKEHEARMPRRS